MRILLAFCLAFVYAGCTLVRPGTLDEAGELLAGGGEVVLRDSLRPARGEPRVLVVALDGVGADVMRDALEAGDLPALSALLGPASGEGLWDTATRRRTW